MGSAAREGIGVRDAGLGFGDAELFRDVATEDKETCGRATSMVGRPRHNSGASAACGRPRVLDGTKRAEICALVAAGCSLRAAADYVGCHVSTISRLKDRDDAFRAQLLKARAEREVTPLAQVRAASKRSWRASVWLLERTVGGRYRRGGAAVAMSLAMSLERAVAEEEREGRAIEEPG